MQLSSWRRQILIALLMVVVTATLGMVYPVMLPWCIVFALIGILNILWHEKQKTFTPQSDTYKHIEKIKKKHAKKADKQHLHIHDQIAYIAQAWGYTKEQEKITQKFIDERAYTEIYNKLTASLLPQVIRLIDHCNDREQKGCKREVSRRIRALTDLMKQAFKKQKSQKLETYETTLEVYDQLLKELK